MENELRSKNVHGAIRLVLTFIIVAAFGTLVIYLIAPEKGWGWSLIYGASIAVILVALHAWQRWRRVKKEMEHPTIEDLFDKRK